MSEKPAPRRFAVLPMSLEDRLALALVEDCFTQLDENDIGYVVDAVTPVVRRYTGSDLRGRLTAALDLTDRFDPSCGSERTRTFIADLTRILRGEA